MADGSFGDAIAPFVELGGDVAMALAMQIDIPQRVGTIGLERTAEVMNVRAGDPRQSGLDRRGHRLREGVRAVRTPAADAVVPLRKHGKQFGDIIRCVLAVGIHNPYGHIAVSLRP